MLGENNQTQRLFTVQFNVYNFIEMAELQK
jgi:hypothetical protein